MEHAEAGHLPSVLGHLTALESLALISCLRVHQAGPGTAESYLAAENCIRMLQIFLRVVLC